MFDCESVARTEERAYVLSRTDIVQYDCNGSFCLLGKLLERGPIELGVGNFSHCCDSLPQSYEKSKKITTFEVDLGGFRPKREM